MNARLLHRVLFSVIPLIFALSINVEKAHGFTYWRCEDFLGRSANFRRSREDMTWRAGRSSFPAGSLRRVALEIAQSRWNQAPGQFIFNYPPLYGDGSCSRNNRQNEVWFSNNQRILDSAPAIAWLDMECTCVLDCTARIKYTDIIFDDSENWSLNFPNRSTKRAYGGAWRPFETAAIHEMGHALGLAHTNTIYNIMGIDETHIYVNDWWIGYYVGEDAGNGEVFLYGSDDHPLRNDVGVTHWKYSRPGGRDNEYSVHILTQIFNSAGNAVIASDAFQGMRRYQVTAGSTYRVEFTYENNGVDDFDEVNVGYYISTDSRITTLDRRIRTRTLTLNRNGVYTQNYSLTIPADLTVGQTYWIGVIVDYTDDILEFNPSNNATYIPIEIIP